MLYTTKSQVIKSLYPRPDKPETFLLSFPSRCEKSFIWAFYAHGCLPLHWWCGSRRCLRFYGSISSLKLEGIVLSTSIMRVHVSQIYRNVVIRQCISFSLELSFYILIHPLIVKCLKESLVWNYRPIEWIPLLLISVHWPLSPLGLPLGSLTWVSSFLSLTSIPNILDEWSWWWMVRWVIGLPPMLIILSNFPVPQTWPFSKRHWR